MKKSRTESDDDGGADGRTAVVSAPMPTSGKLEDDREGRSQSKDGEFVPFPARNAVTTSGELEKGGSPSNDAELYRSASSKAMLRILPVICPLIAVSFMERSVLSLTASPIIDELGISTTTFGFAAAIFYIPYSLLAVPTVWLAKFFSVKALLVCLPFVWGLATFSTGFITTNAELLTLRFILGAAEAGSLPLIFFYLDMYFSPRDLAQLWSSAVLVSVNTASIIAAPVATLILVSLDGALGAAAWRWVYFILGATAIIQSGLVAVFLIDKPADTNALTEEEKGAIRRMKEAVTSSKPGEDTGKPDLLAGIKDWRSVYLGLLALLHAVAVTTFQLFTPLVIETLTSDILMDPNDAYILSVALTTTPYIFAIVFLGFTGYLQKYSPSSWRPWNGITIVVVTIILATILPPLYTSGIFLVSYLALCFLIGVTNSFTGIQDTLPAIYLQLGGASPSYFAAQSTFRGMAAIFSPPIFGALLPVLGASEAVRAIVLATKIPVLVLFVGWFYIIQRDMPI